MQCKCYTCGKFCKPIEVQLIYSGYPLSPDKEIFRCQKCIDKYGSFKPQVGIKPEYSVFKLTKEK